MSTHDDKLETPIAICGVRFDHATYYEDAELLYLTKGVPLGAADGDTIEGHTVFAGEDGRVVGLLIQCPRQDLAESGALNVTLRDGGPTTRLPREIVEDVLVRQAVRDGHPPAAQSPRPTWPRRPRRARASRSARAPSAGR